MWPSFSDFYQLSSPSSILLSIVIQRHRLKELHPWGTIKKCARGGSDESQIRGALNILHSKGRGEKQDPLLLESSFSPLIVSSS